MVSGDDGDDVKVGWCIVSEIHIVTCIESTLMCDDVAIGNNGHMR